MNKSPMKNFLKSTDVLPSALETLLLLKTAEEYQQPGCRISRAVDFASPALVLGFGELPCATVTDTWAYYLISA